MFVGSIYKSVRWALCDLLLRLGNCDANAEQLAPLLDDLEGAFYLLERYRDHEERRIYPLVKEVAPTAVQRLSLQHQHEIAELRGLAARAEPNEARASETLERLYLEFSRFVGNTLLHLFDEEVLTTQALLLVHDAAFAQVHTSIMNDMGPDERALFRRVLLPSTRPTWRKHVGING